MRRAQARWRRSLSGIRRRKAALGIGVHLSRHPRWRRARTLAVYAPVRGEADPRAALRRCSGKRLVYPRIFPNGIKFVRPRRFAIGRLGIAQPLGPVVPLHRLDMLLIPLLAFDRCGNRLGQGGGHYDRLLAAPHRAARVGIAYREQEVQRIPAAPWDQPLHWVATPRRLLRTRSGAAAPRREKCRTRR